MWVLADAAPPAAARRSRPSRWPEAKAMTIKLRVKCVRGMYWKEECVRVIAMDDSTSLLDLHEMIQDAVSFDQDHPFEFYVANSASPWAEKAWVTLAEDWDEKVDAFEATHLKDIWPLGRKKLYYWFDFGDDWIFEIRKMRSAKADASLDTPQILERVGLDPEQYPSWGE